MLPKLIEIHCGEESTSGSSRRQLKKHVDFFEKEVEVYTSPDIDPSALLFRPADLARTLDCHESKVGMTLKRKGEQIAGVYRASGYRFKPSSILGLKNRSYFLTLEACAEIKDMFARKRRKSPKRPSRQFFPEKVSSPSLTSFSSSITASTSSTEQEVAIPASQFNGVLPASVLTSHYSTPSPMIQYEGSGNTVYLVNGFMTASDAQISTTGYVLSQEPLLLPMVPAHNFNMTQAQVFPTPVPNPNFYSTQYYPVGAFHF
jgi:hypothetical protein